MVIIRLSRGGSHKKPFYQIVAADRRSACQGKYLERVGFFNPIAKGAAERLVVDSARVNYWLGVGAKLSERVASLMKEHANPELMQQRKAKSARKTLASISSTEAATKAALTSAPAADDALVAAKAAAADAENSSDDDSKADSAAADASEQG